MQRHYPVMHRGLCGDQNSRRHQVGSERRCTDVGLLRVPLRQTGNSGIPTTEDAEAGAHLCIDANFTSGETTGGRDCGDKEMSCHANFTPPNSGVRTPGVLRDCPARARCPIGEGGCGCCGARRHDRCPRHQWCGARRRQRRW